MAETALMSRTPSVGTMASNDPFFRTFDRLFNDSFLQPFGLMNRFFTESLGEGTWRPAADIAETDEAYQVSVELPGLTKNDIEVTVENNVLTISGERKWDAQESRDRYHRVERYYGKFSRSFSLPQQVTAEKVQASFKDGILSVTVPKAENARPRRIAIH